jgi:hypothetical protein
MQRRVFLILAAFLTLPAMAQAAVTVTVGNHNLVPETAGQIVDILIAATEGEGLNSMDLSLIENNLVAGGPVITAIDLVSAATIWGASPSTQFGGVDPPTSTEIFNSVAVNSTSTDVSANGILARLTVDTTGTAVGSYALEINRQDGSIGPTTMFAVGGEIFPTYINGSLNVVPEPSSIVMGMFAVAGLACVAIRRRARRAA